MNLRYQFQNCVLGTPLEVHWLRHCAFTAWVQFLVRELRSHMLCSLAQKWGGGGFFF